MRLNWFTILGYTLAIVAFFVVATYAVSYAIGYKIDWQAKSLKKTGFILIESYPKGASVKLSGKEIGGTTPETIKRLLPGTYQVELAKDGYRPWQSDISVKSGLVAEERNILLTFQELKPTSLLDLPISSMAGNTDNTKIAGLTGKDILLWDVKSKTKATGVNSSLIRQQIKDHNIADIANGKLEPLGFAPDNQTLLFQSKSLSNQYYLTLNTSSGVFKLIASGRNITNWKWLNDKEIAWLQNRKLNLFNFNSGKTQVLASEIIDYAFVDNNLYIVAQNKTGKSSLTRIDRTGANPEEIAELPTADGYYLGKIKNNWLVISTLNKISSIWLEDKQGGLITWKLLADNVRSKVLWDDIYLIYKQAEQLMVIEWEKLDLPLKIAQLHGGELAHFSFDTILYIENQQLKSVDLTGKNQYDLLPIADANKFIITEPQISKIIFIDAKTKQLTEATLREKTSLLF